MKIYSFHLHDFLAYRNTCPHSLAGPDHLLPSTPSILVYIYVVYMYIYT